MNAPPIYMPASFRGVPFEGTAWSLPNSRRLVVTEYPGSDRHTIQDLGLTVKRYGIKGFLSGPSAPIVKDLLIDACMKPGAGPFLHPQQGLIMARCESIEYSEDAESLNYIELSMVFVADGYSISFGVINTAIAAGKAVAAKVSAQIYAASRITYQKLNGASQEALIVNLEDRADSAVAVASQWPMSEEKAGYIDAMADIGVYARDYSSDISALASAIQAATALVTSPADLATISAVAVADWIAKTAIAVEVPVESLVYAEMAENAAGAAELFAVTTLAQLAARYAVEEYASYDEALAKATSISSALVAASELTADTDTSHALDELRSAVWLSMMKDAQQLPRLVAIEIAGLSDALDIACRLYNDADRADELIDRNNVAHPGFISAEPGSSFRALSE